MASDSRVVVYKMTNNPKFEVSNPATPGTRRKKIAKNVFTCNVGQEVGQGRENEPTKIEGSNPATVGSGERELYEKKFYESSFGGAKTLSKMTLSIMTLIINTLIIITLSIKGLFDTQLK